MKRAKRAKQPAKLAIVHAELERIAKKHRGQLRPPDVVDAARPKTAVLHSHFEWRDGIAAERYRLVQAQMLIRVTVTMIETGDDQSREFRAFVSLSSDRQSKQGYRTMVSVMSNPTWRAQLLEDALSELNAFRLRYKSLVELATVFDAIDGVKV
jgi:hypothetical protein